MIDNSTDFDNKVRRVIQVICKRLGKRLGVNVDDRLKVQSKKRKFLVKTIPPVEVSQRNHHYQVSAYSGQFW